MYVAIKSIENSRQMRYQSLNAYRKRFGMRPYSSFEDMTGETKSLRKRAGGKVDIRRLRKSFLST